MLSTPLSEAIRTTSFHARRLKQLGIETVKDFLLYFPRRYADSREVRRILDIQIGQFNTIRGTIKSIASTSGWRRRMKITTALLSDESGSIEAIWFNQAYLAKTLQRGTEIMINGKTKYDTKRARIIFQNPDVEIVKPKQIHLARIVPVYHETELNAPRKVRGKISSKWIREKLFPLLKFAEDFPEYLPQEILKKYHFMPYSQAIRNAHFPTSKNALDKAKKRLSFDELFLLQLAALHRKYLWRKIAAKEQKQIPINWSLIKNFTKSLPWALTNAQKKAIYEIVQDLSKPFPMSRLLEGDTGSGKTVVAAAAVLHVIKGTAETNFQACLIAPTEILARQHFETFSKLLKPFDIKPALLIGALAEKVKKIIAEQLKNGEISFVVGTHALLQNNIAFKKLGLAIIDEQHRFGVKQRQTLKSYGGPHVLSLTATPIPRTLALVLYGDQDLSLLDEMPPGRQKILTRIVPEEKRPQAYKWIENEIAQGSQAFIIFPLIEESEELQVKAAIQEFERLKEQIFPKLSLGLLHGQMSAEKKAETMKNFSAGKIQILVSTAVVEVGVDVPNATIMMIEGAERFGLAQLHQFRGRVGRSDQKSYCLLFPTLQNPQIFQRLHALEKYNSGFYLAEIDLQLRGPGEVYGIAQSGIPDLKMASLTDANTIKQAREAAEMIIQQDPQLKMHDTLREKIAEQENIAIE
ncbi:ATP-dependent DNA helicase RecG [Candidatus Peregrinibacteria bacterium]|nr:ATP-dependent DNA helicase RecG [Candidatus Peregrinibacteria bacterium]